MEHCREFSGTCLVATNASVAEYYGFLLRKRVVVVFTIKHLCAAVGELTRTTRDIGSGSER